MRRFLAVVAVTLLAAAIMLAGLSTILLGTATGGTWMLHLAEKLTQGSPYALRVTGFSGTIGHNARAATVTLADAGGIWLQAQKVHLVPNWPNLWHGKPFLEQADAQTLTLIRLPQSQTATQPASPSSGIPSTWQTIALYIPQRLNIRNLELQPKLTGQPQTGNFAVTVQPATGQYVWFNLHSLQGPQTTLSATLPLSPALPVAVNLTEQPNGLLGGLLGLPHTSLNLTAKGPPTQLRVTLDASSSTPIKLAKVTVAKSSLQAGLELDATNPAQLPFTGNLTLKANLMAGNTTYPLHGVVAGHGNRQTVNTSTTLSILGNKGQMTSRLETTLQPQSMAAQTSLTAWFSQGGQNVILHGRARVDEQSVSLQKLNAAGPGVDVSASGSWNRLRALAEGSAHINISNLGPWAALLGIGAQGSLNGDAVLQSTDGRQYVNAHINALNFSYGGQKIRLQNPASLYVNATGARLSPFTLYVAGGTLTASGEASTMGLQGQAVLRNLNLAQLAPADTLSGRANATLTLGGTPAQPTLGLRGNARGQSGNNPLTAAVSGSWIGNALRLEGKISSGKATAQAKATLATRLGLLPFYSDYGQATKLEGNIETSLPLESLNPYLWATRQHVGGAFRGRAILQGTVGSPQVEGHFNLSNGTYDHSTSGVCLRGVRAEVYGNTSKLTLKNLYAADDRGGNLSGNGELDLKGEKPLAVQLHFNTLQLFCGGLAKGTVNGTVRAEGNLYRNSVGGELTLGNVNVQIPGRQNETDIPQVETVRAGTPLTREDATTYTRLNVTLKAPEHVFVRGRGLDAEFGGTLYIGGSTAKPLLTGELTSQRGKFTLLDRTLKLAQTTLRFEGSVPPSPYLSVKATSQVQSTVLQVNLSGPAQTPTLTLTSTPPLPQDEILALLLFGRRLQSISPFQAIQLAQATRQLAGLDDGEPGLLEKARNTLKLDTLDIGTNQSTNNFTITTGKYVTDKIYLGVQQGNTPADRAVTTEIELTPSINANTSVNGFGNQSVGIGWKRDY